MSLPLASDPKKEQKQRELEDWVDMVIELNTFSKIEEQEIQTPFCFISLINHSRQKNTRIGFLQPNLVMVFAAEDIQEGQEILMDYCADIQDVDKRNAVLAKHGIAEDLEY